MTELSEIKDQIFAIARYKWHHNANYTVVTARNDSHYIACLVSYGPGVNEDTEKLEKMTLHKTVLSTTFKAPGTEFNVVKAYRTMRDELEKELWAPLYNSTPDVMPDA